MQQIILKSLLFIKPKVKRLKNIDRLAELPIYEQLSMIKTDQVFKGYEM